MSTDSELIKIYSTGKTTVVGFGGKDLLDDVNLSDFRDMMVDLVKQHQAEVLAFDLTGVKLIPSGLLGLLASIRQTGAEVHLYNPSPDVREVLLITRLDQLMPIHEVKLD